MENDIKKYSNEDITITWEPSKCTHSTNCWRQLITVFNPKNRPWINIQGADTERIKTQIGHCPSGALTYQENK